MIITFSVLLCKLSEINSELNCNPGFLVSNLRYRGSIFNTVHFCRNFITYNFFWLSKHPFINRLKFVKRLARFLRVLRQMVPLPYSIANDGIIPVGFSDHSFIFGVRKLHRIKPALHNPALFHE